MDFYDFFSEIMSEEGIWILILIASAFAVASFILLTLRMEPTPRQRKAGKPRKQNKKETTAEATMTIPVPKTDITESIEMTLGEITLLQDNLQQEESKSKKKTFKLWGRKKKDEDAVEMAEEKAPTAEILESIPTPKEDLSESEEITLPQPVAMATPGTTIDPFDPTSLPNSEQTPVSVNSPTTGATIDPFDPTSLPNSEQMPVSVSSPTTGVTIDPFEITPPPDGEQLPAPNAEAAPGPVVDPFDFTPLPALDPSQQSSSAGGAISMAMAGAQIDVKAGSQQENGHESDSDENQEDWDTTGGSGGDIFDLFDEAEETDSEFAELANSLEDVQLEGLLTDTEDIVNNLKGLM